jgi:hypothetical protein
MRSLLLAPIPKFFEFFSPFFDKRYTQESLGAPWTRGGDISILLSRSAWSFALILLWRRRCFGGHASAVWLPEYFCNSALTPLRALGASLFFYPVKSDGSPDFPKFNQFFSEHAKVDVFVLTHFFGVPTPSAETVLFCKSKAAWLVEDAAHVISPIPGVGEVGDCVLYSPHKHMAIPDGAILIVRQLGPNLLGCSSQCLVMLSEARTELFSRSKRPNFLPYKWLLKRLMQIFGLRSRAQLGTLKICTQNYGGKLIGSPQLSCLSHYLLPNAIGRFEDIKRHRQFLINLWSMIFSSPIFNGIIFPADQNGDAYLAKYSAAQSPQVSRLFENLRQSGIPAITWPDLPPEVCLNQVKYEVAIKLAQSHIYFPIHLGITKKELILRGRKLLNQYYEAWSIVAIENHSEWESLWVTISKSNVLQSWEYGEAKASSEGWGVVRFMICNDANSPVGVVQVLFKDWFFGGIARINRGPLVLGVYCDEFEVNIKQAILSKVIAEAQRRRWRVIQVAPEIGDSQKFELGLELLGFKKQKNNKWSSGLISLEGDEQSILMGFHGKWRNSMRKGLSLGVLTIETMWDKKSLKWLLNQYADLQNKKNFTGVSPALLQSLAKQKGAHWKFTLLVGYRNPELSQKDALGWVVVACSGDTAIYFLGGSTQTGRNLQVNSVLLWDAIRYAKAAGCMWFDVGGLSGSTPKGIAEFKRGLNPKPYSLIGEWRLWTEVAL